MIQHVLIVDDTEVNLVLFGALVKKLGNCVEHVFSQPLKALEWAAENDIDLVIVDYMMPEMDGLQFINHFRALAGCETVPLLMITANDQKQVRYRALDSGANDFLTKPVDKVEFLARAKNMLVVNEANKHLAQRATWLSEEVRKATAEIVARERDTVIRLCRAAEYRDPETGAHILRMAHFSKLIAAGLGMPLAQQELLLEAAPMHDIGKVGISDNILLKPGRLDEAEFNVMKQHAQFGYELLKGSSSLVLQTGADIALGHHEKFDGSGYPSGLKGEEIPIFSRIVAVADVFDALTSERPYKKAWTLEAAVEFLVAGSGQHFDPQCVNAFLSAWEQVLEIRDHYQG
ncbi:response regulator [Rhodoferax aquaticus]|uniref:Response regulator n=2 Tax=Rhodoferax aquaticus TaxID=2527691 RepID=A0A515EW35_9BURK|nr:response regulator [Rhodoferax aquaticus]